MDDQQDFRDTEPTLPFSDIEIAWLAGMMNGDGCFSLNLRKREKRWKCDISVTLTQTDPSIIERASAILIRKFRCNPSIMEYPPSGAGIRTKYNMRITKMSHIVRILDGIVPYMCGSKLAKAKLMLRYCRNRVLYDGKSRKKNTIENDSRALDLASQFYKLNEREVPKEISTILRGHPERE
jgi:hypothetical protein